MEPTAPALPSGFNTERFSHAYITAPGLAGTLAAAAVCTARGSEKPCLRCPGCDKASRGIHPDIIYIDKPHDKREILVEQIRTLKKDVIVIPSESEKKVYVINNADLMNPSSQNAFLRILEEPPGYAVFILSTETPSSLLATVRSRCVEIKSGPEAKAPVQAENEMAERFFTSLEQGNAAIAGFMFQLDKLDKEALGRFLTAAEELSAMRLRNDAASGRGITRATAAAAARALGKAREMLDLNVSAGHISGFLCATLIENK